MYDYKLGQLVVILSAFSEVEVYGNIKFITNESLTISVKTPGLLKEGWEILCLVIDETDMYEFYSKVELLEDNEVLVQRPVETGLSVIEKRRFGRVDCQIGFIARPMIINNISVIKSGKTFAGTIKNISAGGVLAETNLCLPVDSVFGFKLKANYFIDCISRVRRVTEVPGEKRFEMGCEFINMSVDNIKSISMFAFKEQLRHKQKELYKTIFK